MRDEMVAENGAQSIVDDNFEIDEACCMRFLRVRNMDKAMAKQMLHKTIAWRRVHVASLAVEHFETIKHEGATGKVFVSPFLDNDGRPILIMRPHLENTSDVDAHVKYLIYQLERAVAATRATGKHETWLTIVDLSGFSLRNSSLTMTLKSLEIIQDNYPGCLHRFLLLDGPKLFSYTFNAAMPFVGPALKALICFVGGAHDGPGGARAALLTPHLPLSSLQKCLGGAADHTYCAEEYFAEDQRRFEDATRQATGRIGGG